MTVLEYEVDKDAIYAESITASAAACFDILSTFNVPFSSDACIEIFVLALYAFKDLTKESSVSN